MAELADALDSGSSTFTGVGVQLSLAAPKFTKFALFFFSQCYNFSWKFECLFAFMDKEH